MHAYTLAHTRACAHTHTTPYQVTALIEKHKHFEQSEVENIANHVEGLKARYSSVEASGHSELNELRGMAASLERQWNKFSKEMKSHSTNLAAPLECCDGIKNLTLSV